MITVSLQVFCDNGFDKTLSQHYKVTPKKTHKVENNSL